MLPAPLGPLAAEDHVFEVEPEGYGIGLSITMCGDMYLLEEALELADMLCRVTDSWLRTREMINLNPEKYGHSIN